MGAPLIGQVAPSPVQPDFGHCQEWIPPHHPSFPKPLDSDGMGVVLSGTATCSYCNLWVWWGFVLFLLNWVIKIPLSQDSLCLWGCAISHICTAFAGFSIPWDAGWDSNLAPTRAHSQACGGGLEVPGGLGPSLTAALPSHGGASTAGHPAAAAVPAAPLPQ